MTPTIRLFAGVASVLAVSAILSAVAVHTNAAPNRKKSAVGPADMVLIDKSCTMQMAATPSGEVKTAPGSANVILCWRGQASFRCQLVTPDPKDGASGRTIEFSILEERAPFVAMLSTAPVIMVSVDWSTASFVLGQTSVVEVPGGNGIVQKICAGHVMTGEAFESVARRCCRASWMMGVRSDWMMAIAGVTHGVS